MLSVQRIGRTLPESRFIHLIRDGRDVALSQSGAGAQRAAAARRAGRALGQADPQVARAGGDAEGRPLRRGPLRGPRPRPRDDAAADLRVHRPALGRRRCSATTSAPPSGSSEMAGELRAEGTHATQQAGYRIDNHAPTTKPPDPSKLDKWRREMSAEDLARLRGRRRRAARASSATRWRRRCASASSPSGSTAGRRSSPATSATRSTRAATRPSSSPARPRTRAPMAAHVDRTGVWDQPGVTEASDWEVPFDEYERWIADNDIEVVHWDNCYQHEEIARLRDAGRQDGRPLRLGDVLARGRRAGEARLRRPLLDDPLRAGALRRARDREPLRPVGPAPGAARRRRTTAQAAAPRDRDDLVRFYFPGALLGPRKPHKEVVEAFRARRATTCG